jgi:hypothetical protein
MRDRRGQMSFLNLYPYWLVVDRRESEDMKYFRAVTLRHPSIDDERSKAVNNHITYNYTMRPSAPVKSGMPGGKLSLTVIRDELTK